MIQNLDGARQAENAAQDLSELASGLAKL